MAALSNYFSNKLIDFLLRGGTYTPPSTLYVALCTATPVAANTGSSIPEISGGNYSRSAISSGSSNWFSTQGTTAAGSTGTTGTSGNVNAISWSSVTWSGTVVGVAICDAATLGNVLWFAPLVASRVVTVGESLSFQSSTLSPSLN